MAKRPPFALVIMDGWGVASPWGGNATSIAKTPTISHFWQKTPKSILGAAEQSVGLPKGEPGNSEVGHLNIGSGQIVHQDLPSISAMIKDGSFFNNDTLSKAMSLAIERNTQLHLIGLLSDGGIHSHIDHLLALIEMAKKHHVQKVLVHIFTDGRDSAPMDALRYITVVENALKDLPDGRIASVMGRYYAMDRDRHWDRIERAYRVLTEGIGNDALSVNAGISQAYRNNQSDEFILPTIIRSKNQTLDCIKDNDVIIFYNFRGDRARQLTEALVQEKFNGFNRHIFRKNIEFITFTSYQEGLPVKIAFALQMIKSPLAKILSDHDLSQLHIAETEKYPHVTYFFNGGVENPFPREDRKMIPSPKVPTYDQKPEMSARLITQELLHKLNDYDFFIINFANPDMVGHSGLLRPTVKAVEVVDECVGRLWQALNKIGGNMIVTADHGNAEQMINPATGKPDTEHTKNPVPFFFVAPASSVKIRPNGILADIAPSILDFLNLPIPKDIMGESLIIK